MVGCLLIAEASGQGTTPQPAAGEGPVVGKSVSGEIGKQIAGYRRDGTGVFPGITPPTNNLVQQWVVKMPGGPEWSSPIVVGDRVFLTVDVQEGQRDFPALVCVDGATGKILWDKPLDHLSAVPAAVAEPARAAWHDVMADYGKRFEFDRTKDTNAMEAAGYHFAEGGYGYSNLKRAIPKDLNPTKTKANIAAKAGLTLESWNHGFNGGGVGFAFATPVSDGKYIWSCNSWGGFFCHDLDGNVVWVAWVPAPNRAWGEYCRNARSPILWKDPKTGQVLLISDITNLARALDAATGKVVWTDEGPASKDYKDSQGDGAHTIVSPMVMNVGGQEILYAAGNNAYLLPEGKRLPVVGWTEYGMQTLVKYDERDVIFFCGQGEHCGWKDKGVGTAPNPPAAVRFALTGSNLTATVLWDGQKLDHQFRGGNKPWMLYCDKGFYHPNGAIMDTLDGSIKVGKLGRSDNEPGRAVPPSSHLLLAGGGHIYGLTRGGDLTVFTADGKKVSEIKLVQPDSKQFCGRDGAPFVLAKDAIYVRSDRYLHRVGSGAAAGK
jgi:hypothetical protein